MKKKIVPVVIFLLCILPWIFLTYRFFLSDPLIHPDEAIIFDSAHTLATKGKLATNILGNAFPGLIQHDYIHPPVYYYVLAGWTNVFGESIEAVRALSASLGFLSLVIFFLLVRNLFKSNALAGIGVIFLSLDPEFGSASRVGRMEILTFFLILISIWVYLCIRQKHKIFWHIGLGILCGLAVFTHPLGLIALTTIVLHILVNGEPLKTKVRRIICLTIPLLIMMIIYYVSMQNSFNIFLAQNRLTVMYKASRLPFAFIIFQKDIATAVLYITYFITCVISGIFLFLFPSFFPYLSFFLIGFSVSTAALLLGKDSWYLIYFQPFITLLFLYLVTAAWRTKKKLLMIAAAVPIFIAFFINADYYRKLFTRSLPNITYHEYVRLIAANLPTSGTVLLYSLPDPYFDLRQKKGLKLYEGQSIFPSPILSQKLFDKVDYVALSTFFPLLGQYVYANMWHMTYVRYADEYAILIVQLVPKTQRRWAVK